MEATTSQLATNSDDTYLVGIVGAFSVAVTVGLHLTGIITCRKIVAQRDVGPIPHLPFLAAALNSSLWLMYGVMVDDLSIKVVNLIGFSLQSSYAILYYNYVENPYWLKRDVAVAATLVAIIVSYFFLLAPSTPFTTQCMGLVCNVFTVLFFASPLATMSQVIKTKCVESISLPLSVASAIMGLSWVVYGRLIDDILVQFPNGLGFLLSVVQLSLFLIYPRTRSSPLNTLPV